ncbi:hypothetical protein Hdeb2414_s0095g00791831 [Helianthus debilis subsp. tardiflorus]
MLTGNGNTHCKHLELHQFLWLFHTTSIGFASHNLPIIIILDKVCIILNFCKIYIFYVNRLYTKSNERFMVWLREWVGVSFLRVIDNSTTKSQTVARIHELCACPHNVPSRPKIVNQNV